MVKVNKGLTPNPNLGLSAQELGVVKGFQFSSG